MKYKELYGKENENIKERYEMTITRIKEISDEVKDSSLISSVKDYVKCTTEFILYLDEIKEKVENGVMENLSTEELKDINNILFKDIRKSDENAYRKTYLCPDYAYESFSKDMESDDAKALARMLSSLYVLLRSCIAGIYQFRFEEVTQIYELYLEVYGILCENEDDFHTKNKAIKNSMYYFAYDYAQDYIEFCTRSSLDVDYDFILNIIMNYDLSDERYLYMYGECIGENELKVSKYLSKMTEDEIKSMAATYVDGYVEGFEYAGIDLEKKETVNIRYNIGFERIVKEAIIQFEKIGLKPVIYMNHRDFRKASPRKVGVVTTAVDNQYDYDHRYDMTYFMNKSLLDRYIVCTRLAYEKFEKEASVFAGPACIEVFGEMPFNPENSDNVISPDKKAMKLLTAFNQERSLLIDEFINHSQTSFTIIAYPIPEIGENFKEIFDETVKINTLDKKMYREIQEKLIEALNKGKSVHIKGMNGNTTDLSVALAKLNDPEKETLFENCLADVNIPVGEVFTSPQLKGTNGTLNVSKVYLNDLEYRNLTIEFKDGMIDDYSCDNFSDSEKGKRYFHENVMYGHDSLPMGEFAIGTNTVAYVMGKKYNISDKLPILIAEKTGPHFAVGDTCYSMSEDNKVYNPDGKEIIAKDNEISVLRKTDIDKAYFNCHTDITIPYDELGLIEVCCEDGNIKLIENGKFVLDGTEKLNEALENL